MSKTKSVKKPVDPFRACPLITREALKANDLDALLVVPKCLGFAEVMDHPGVPFDWDSVTLLRPEGKNAGQVLIQTIRYASLCEQKRFGGGINININGDRDGSEYLKSTYSSRAKGLGGNNTTIIRIFTDAQPHERVQGAAHVTRPEPGSNVMSFDAIVPGPAKRSGRQVAVAHAARYARLHAPEGYDIEAYLANLDDLFKFHDELMASA